MIDPGLNHRLRQRSRRAGIMIGISMALTLAVCVFSFTVIYAQLDNVVSDFVSQADEDPTETAVAEANPTNPPAAQANSTQPPARPTNAPTAAPTKGPTAAPTKEDADAFTPDYQIGADSVNLRSGPGTSFGVVTALPFETPLMYLDDSQPTSDPDADGFNGDWMKFRTEDGQEGWVREIDVSDYQP